LIWISEQQTTVNRDLRGYVEGLVSVIGHADRAGPLRDYCVGLMLPCERKSVEPMAAVTAPARVVKHTCAESLAHMPPIIIIMS
jgi:SRSO17 transposase